MLSEPSFISIIGFVSPSFSSVFLCTVECQGLNILPLSLNLFSKSLLSLLYTFIYLSYNESLFLGIFLEKSSYILSQCLNLSRGCTDFFLKLSLSPHPHWHLKCKASLLWLNTSYRLVSFYALVRLLQCVQRHLDQFCIPFNNICVYTGSYLNFVAVKIYVIFSY